MVDKSYFDTKQCDRKDYFGDSDYGRTRPFNNRSGIYRSYIRSRKKELSNRLYVRCLSINMCNRFMIMFIYWRRYLND